MDKRKFNYIVPIQIRFNDIDGQQHVNNGVYQSYYDLGRSGYLSAISGQDYTTGGRSVVVASVQTDFIKPIFLNDSIQVETRVKKIGKKSIHLEQRITESNTGEVKSSCTTVFVGYDYEKQKSIEISDEFKAMIHEFEKSGN